MVVDPTLGSWVPGADGSGFPVQNLPYGVVSGPDQTPPRPAVRIGDHVLDLMTAATEGLLEGHLGGASVDMLAAPTLNPLLAAGPATWQALRSRLVELLCDGGGRDRVQRCLIPRQAVRCHLPVEVGDYVDFYSSREHATNLGRILRPGTEPLLPNWCHLPVGYHGRSATLVVSGTPVRRPWGQRRAGAEAAPDFGPTGQLDFELEVGFVVGTGNRLGEPIAPDAAADHIFGMVLVNDWSARDIQAWEYQPLGPFLGKSFATTVSAWVVPLDALGPFFVPGPDQEPAPLPYLRTRRPWNLDLTLEVRLRTATMTAEDREPVTISRTSARHLYWNIAQQLAHLTSNGARVRPGDLCASGTVSGPDPGTEGSMIELTWRGERPLAVPGGERRAFLEDGDEITLAGWCAGPSHTIAFGAATGTVMPGAAPSSRADDKERP